MTEKKIIVVGSSNTDMIIKSEQLPEIGETITGGEFQSFSGGKGANQVVAAARAGASAAFIGSIGDDYYGIKNLKFLADEKIDVSKIKITPNISSGIALIMIDSIGENFISVAAGANKLLMPEDIDKIDFKEYSYLLTQFEIPYDTVKYSIKKAKESGCKVILNAAPALEIHSDILLKTDILIANKIELCMIAGVSKISEEDIIYGADSLINEGVSHVIVTIGSRGLYYISEDNKYKISAPRVNSVDTVGAGDCFCGAFAAALSRDLKMGEALKFAVAAASISVQKTGVQASFPHQKEIEIFLEDNHFENCIQKI